MRGHRRGQQGAILVLTAFLLPFIILFTGFAVDAGNAYIHRSKLQNSVDAAALAGGYKYAENESLNDTKIIVDDYMKLNQGKDTYKINNITPNSRSEDDAIITDITVDVSEKVPIYFLGAALKYFYVDITDEEAKNWNIKVAATVRVKKGKKGTSSNQPSSIFDYAMIGARRKPATHDYQYVNYMPWNADVPQSFIFTSPIKIKGKLHANGAIYLNDYYEKSGDYSIYVEKFSCYAETDADLWDNFRGGDTYFDHYINGIDGYYENGKKIYYYEQTPDEVYRAHVNKGHMNDEKIPGIHGLNGDMSWRFYARFGTFDHKDYTAENSHTNDIDIDLSDKNPLTKSVYDMVEYYRKMSPEEREKNYVYVDTDGKYYKQWLSMKPRKQYEFTQSHNKQIYPGITCNTWGFPFYKQQGASFVDSNVYKIIIVDGNLNINGIPADVMHNNETDHAIFISLHGDIHIQNDGPFYGYAYAPQGNILLDGNNRIYGSIVAQSIRSSSAYTIEHKKFTEGGTPGGDNESSSDSSPSISLIK